jgi:hypothetical protein
MSHQLVLAAATALTIIIALPSAFVGETTGTPAPAPSLEYQVKAAYLFNFTKFVEWPAESSSDPPGPIVIGIVGKDPFGYFLDVLVKEKTVKGRQVIVKRAADLAQLDSCHVLFISLAEAARAPEILERFRGRPVLTIGEHDQFVKQGGMVRFLVANKKVTFEIDADIAERARLKISSRLLGIGRVLRDEK